MKIKLLITLFLLFTANATFSADIVPDDITSGQAIKIALAAAKQKNYDTAGTNIEILKVQNGLERGPMRLVWLARTLPKEVFKSIMLKEFWVIYLYPKGILEGSPMLGGDFTAIIDLQTGEVLDSWLGM